VIGVVRPIEVLASFNTEHGVVRVYAQSATVRCDIRGTSNNFLLCRVMVVLIFVVAPIIFWDG
jgi:hypothetical protein